MADKISVIVPVYNVEPYLERCLDSIIHNTYRNLEIICVDDGSTDGCGGILDRYAQMDERVVVIHKENGGVSSARNCGLDTATGEHIAFVDPDDWVHPQYFEILLKIQSSGNFDLAICGFDRPESINEYEYYDLNAVVHSSVSLDGIYRNRAAKNYVWGKLYRSEMVREKRFVEGIRIAEDSAFNLLVFCSQGVLHAGLVSLPLYYYYNRPGSLAHKLKGRETLDLGEILYGYVTEAKTVHAKRICLLETLKRGLAARYVLSLQPQEKINTERSKTLIRKSLNALSKLPNTVLKEKIQYSIFAYLPITYRFFRIIDDPTLLQMERELRGKRKI